MRLYAGRTTDFIQDATRNNIARRLEASFVAYFRYRPSANEVRSWEESLLRLSAVISSAVLTDHGIFLEYQLPLTSRRLDAMLTGLDDDQLDNAVIIELKQWQASEASDAESMVSTWLGGQLRDTLHPSVQAQQYRDYLADMHTAFHEGVSPVTLSACAYLHNYRPAMDDPILADKFTDAISHAPLFGADASVDLEDFLSLRLRRGKGVPILDRIEKSKLRPSKKLLEHVAAVISGEPRFVLLDEQKVVFERTIAEAKRGFADARKRVLLVQGGPGTGKSVLAANLLGHLSRSGLHTQYATGSKAFTETLRSIVGRRAAAQLTYTNTYTEAEANSVDVLICDEAHRIREKSTSRFMPKATRETMRPQIEELLNAAKVSVFFIDDLQVVRPGETGSAELIRSKARELGAELREYQLEAQFRCAGSDAFVNWVDNTLGIRRTANQIWNGQDESFDFRIFRSVEELEQAIRARAEEGGSARLVAGFCWPWSKARPDGTLVDDVAIGGFRRPWNAPHDAKKLAPGIPKATHWAHDPGGIHQVGCIYTAQGFEFDYVGVIWGRDLRFEPTTQQWVADSKHSHDKVVRGSKSSFSDLVRNTYRVLLSRGLKGCYLYCEDEETAKHLLSRTEARGLSSSESAPESESKVKAHKAASPLPVVPLAGRVPFVNCIPVYDLKLAAGKFGEFQFPDPDAVQWVEPPLGVRPSMDLFVARVEGESMNRIIPNGAWCLFRMNPAGTRHGKVVVAQVHDYFDPDSGGAFTIKRYESVKSASPDGEVSNASIKLRPDSTLDGYATIELVQDEERVRVIAELVRVLT